MPAFESNDGMRLHWRLASRRLPICSTKTDTSLLKFCCAALTTVGGRWKGAAKCIPRSIWHAPQVGERAGDGEMGFCSFNKSDIYYCWL